MTFAGGPVKEKNNMEPRKEANEQDWLNSVKQIFDMRSKENPPIISQGEIESLLIGLNGQATAPVTGRPLSPQGQKTVDMLHGYLDIMKKKKKRFLPIKK
jgi:hypothetical protein